MKLIRHATLPFLLASASLAMAQQATLLRGADLLVDGNRNLLVAKATPAVAAQPTKAVPAPVAADEDDEEETPVKAAPVAAPKPAPAVAKKPAPPADDDEEEEASVTPTKPNPNDNEVDIDAEMGVDKFRGPRKPAVAPKVAANDDDEDEEDEKPKNNPKVVTQIGAGHAAPAPQQAAQQAAPKQQPVATTPAQPVAAAPKQPQAAPKPAQDPKWHNSDEDDEEEDEEEDEPVKPGAAGAVPKKAGAGGGAPTEKWWDSDPDTGLTPKNAVGDGAVVTMTVKPQENAVRINSRQMFTGGRFEVAMKSASVMPGVVTAIYLASGKGRTGDGDGNTGDQDEIDFEFKGNDPNRVQTNVFLGGKEDLLLVDVGENTSSKPHTYVIEWDNKAVNFLIDGKNVRSKPLDRPLKPMQLHMSVWTTMAWAGDTNWDQVGNKEIATEFQVISLPKAQ